MLGHLGTLLLQAREGGQEASGYPAFVEHEFERYLPDGLFVPGEGPRLVFSPLPPPTDQDIAQVTDTIAARLGALARRALEGQETGFPDDEQAVLARSMGEAMVPAVSPQGMFDAMAEAQPPPGLCANIDGFCLHAARTVARGDRSGLEQLCRYGLRAPFSLERLSLLLDGRVRYRLRRPWPTPSGISELVLDPLKFLKRLCALIPYPYANMVRYHGVFANRSRDRARLPAPPSTVSNLDPPASRARLERPPCDPSPPPKPRRSTWASLLMRVLHVDALACIRCGAPMLVLAFISDPRVVKKILDHLRLPTTDPHRAPARLSRQQMEMFAEGFHEEDCDEPSHAPPLSSRGPP